MGHVSRPFFHYIMCLKLTMDTILSMQPLETLLNATHHLPCLARCTNDATESDVSDKAVPVTCGPISVDAQALRVPDLLRCTSRRASRRRLERHARAHTPSPDLFVDVSGIILLLLQALGPTFVFECGCYSIFIFLLQL